MDEINRLEKSQFFTLVDFYDANEIFFSKFGFILYRKAS